MIMRARPEVLGDFASGAAHFFSKNVQRAIR